MLANSNKVQLVGRIGNNPEVRMYEENKKFTKFSIATHEFYKNQHGESVADTTWHNVVAWGKLADVAEKNLTKGIEVAINGKLVNRNYSDSQGVKRFVTEIHLTEILLVSKSERKAA